jgi:hypothetical protein
VIDKELRALLDTTKTETRLLGDIQRLLLQPGESSGLRNDALHPSEISHSDWCPRASYYRLAGVEPSTKEVGTHWQLQMIFDEGREIHHKWQKRIWDIGRLGGNFYCTACHVAWGAVAPSECDSCHADRQFLRYLEVPLRTQSLSLAGHADGLDGDALIEIKSIGLGTLRFEAPELIANHSYKFQLNGKSRGFLDYDALWDSIRRPFPTHLIQGNLYSYMSRRYHTIIFLYECKWNQRVKEFVVKYREERIADRLDMCSQITMALQGGTIPACPFDGCADCQRYEEKHANQGGRILTRRATNPEASKAHAAGNGRENARRRLSRSGDRGADSA